MLLVFRSTVRHAAVAAILALSSLFAAPACGGLISDAHIFYKHEDPETGQFSTTANTFFDATYTPVDSNPSFYLSPYAEIVPGEVRMAFDAQAHSGAFAFLSAAVRDFYVLDGTAVDLVPSQPGTQVSVPVSLHVTGVADRTFFPPLGGPAGGLHVSAIIGNDLAPTGGVTPHNPVIQEPAGQKSMGFYQIPIGEGPAHADINFSVSTNLLVTLGEQFQLAYAVVLQPTFGIDADLTDTATVNFDVGPGLTLTSTNGFGAPVPEPSSFVLLAAGLASLLVWRRARRG